MKSVALIGRGAIGSVVIARLAAGEVPGHRLVGVLDLASDSPDVVVTLDDLLAREPDLVIEVASQEAAKQYGAAVLAAGKELMLLSVGALADRDFEKQCLDALSGGPGRLLISTGAIGGMDALKAMALSGGLRSVSLHSHMRAHSAVQPWMSDAERAALLASEQTTVVFEGSAREAATRFPRVTNVAATVGLCSLGLDAVRARLTASATTDRKTHEIRTTSDVGDLLVRLENRLSPDNPRTSALTPLSILRFLHDTVAPFARGV